ncbi:MAG TPA: diguanylate cyclase [Anaerolineaceae bacterium]|nr:diguanylate cyclase [Anaerolineaceae bacterium]
MESSQIIAEQAVRSRRPTQQTFEAQVSRRGSSWLFSSRPKNANGKHAPHILCVPILSRGQSIGALGVVSMGEKPIFLEDDQLFYQELADRTGLAIENARLYASSQQREREMNALFTATSVLIQTVDQPTLLSQILDAVQSAIPSAVGSALYIDEPESGLLEPWVIQEHHDPRIGIVNSRGEQSQVANAVRNMEAQIVAQPVDDTTAPSMMIAPLVMGEHAFGALTIQGNKPGAFHESDLRLLVSFAATAAAVIQNAILHNELQQLAVTDALTNLLNRRGFYNLSEREVERYQRFNHPLTLLMFDIDDFKQVNDTYGHAVGDQVLAKVAEVCQISLRQIDIMGRIGGDEFAVLLPETDLRTAVHIASRMRQHIADLKISSGVTSVSVTISMGIVSANRDSRNIAALLARADEKLYDAKRHGKNQIIYG